MRHKSAASEKNPVPAELERGVWRRGPESNRPTRICNPVHNRFATAPKTDAYLTTVQALLYLNWRAFAGHLEKREALKGFPLNLERDKRLELSTYTLARYRSTN